MATNAGRYNVICRRLSQELWQPRTPVVIGQVKYAGYDRIIFEGKSESRYICGSRQRVELLCRTPLGKDIIETTDTLKEETDFDARVAVGRRKPG